LNTNTKAGDVFAPKWWGLRNRNYHTGKSKLLIRQAHARKSWGGKKGEGQEQFPRERTEPFLSQKEPDYGQLEKKGDWKRTGKICLSGTQRGRGLFYGRGIFMPGHPKGWARGGRIVQEKRFRSYPKSDLRMGQG